MMSLISEIFRSKSKCQNQLTFGWYSKDHVQFNVMFSSADCWKLFFCSICKEVWLPVFQRFPNTPRLPIYQHFSYFRANTQVCNNDLAMSCSIEKGSLITSTNFDVSIFFIFGSAEFMKSQSDSLVSQKVLSLSTSFFSFFSIQIHFIWMK